MILCAVPMSCWSTREKHRRGTKEGEDEHGEAKEEGDCHIQATDGAAAENSAAEVPMAVYGCLSIAGERLGESVGRLANSAMVFCDFDGRSDW